jgi:hypothetical protein
MRTQLALTVTLTLTSIALSFNSGLSRAFELRDPLLYAHEGHDHATPNAEPAEAEHEHSTIEVSANQPIPTVALIAHPDGQQGWNLEVQTANFSFAPERIGQAGDATNEGHAHLYIDGVKITRLYGNWYYLESLAPGKHEITVSLNTNGHAALMHNGQPIQATVIVDALMASH